MLQWRMLLQDINITQTLINILIKTVHKSYELQEFKTCVKMFC